MLPWHIRLTDQTICLGHTTPPCLFDYYPDALTAQADLPRANRGSLAPEGGYHVMTYAAFQEGMRAFYLQGPLEELTAEQYDYWRNVLPPESWERDGALSRFLIAEYQQGSYTRQVAAWRGHYFSRIVDASDRTTWITAAQCAARGAKETA